MAYGYKTPAKPTSLYPLPSLEPPFCPHLVFGPLFCLFQSNFNQQPDSWVRPGFISILKITNCKRTTMMNSIMGLRELSSTRFTKYRTEIFVLVQLATQTKLLMMFLISSTCRMRFWEQIFVAPNV